MGTTEKVAILDAGAQYGKCIDRRVRELGVETVILPIGTPVAQLRDYSAFIISGGPESVYDPGSPCCDPGLFSLGKPVLGICYGMQLMNVVLGGHVEKGKVREDNAEIVKTEEDGIFRGLSCEQRVLLTHGDFVTHIAPGFRITARSPGCVAAIVDESRKLYGVQFHPEVDRTEHGREMLRNFLYHIAGLSGSYTMENREETAIRYIRERVGEKKVLALLSGGVDSTVLGALLAKAIGPERVHAIHVDNGLMRLNESANVQQALASVGLNVMVIHAAQQFYNATTTVNGRTTQRLNETISPREKRYIIGDEFMRVVDRELMRLGVSINDVYLAQGTLRPDLIESASALASTNAAIIKPHHNDTALVRQFRSEGRVIEPLQELHKDEVRKLGLRLGLPPEIVWRQPFPGPGLAVRILCADAQVVDPVFEQLHANLRCAYAQSTLLPVKTVGVQGDGGSYKYVAALSGPVDWKQLFAIAQEIPKEFHNVNRVVYLYGGQVHSVSITPTRLTPEVISQLQHADDIVNRSLFKNNLTVSLSQVPVISTPLSFDGKGDHSIVIRPFITKDFMTGVAAVPCKDLPESCLEEMVGAVSQVQGVSRVMYDLTSKPPATTEWE